MNKIKTIVNLIDKGFDADLIELNPRGGLSFHCQKLYNEYLRQYSQLNTDERHMLKSIIGIN